MTFKTVCAHPPQLPGVHVLIVFLTRRVNGGIVCSTHFHRHSWACMTSRGNSSCKCTTLSANLARRGKLTSWYLFPSFILPLRSYVFECGQRRWDLPGDNRCPAVLPGQKQFISQISLGLESPWRLIPPHWQWGWLWGPAVKLKVKLLMRELGFGAMYVFASF